MPKYTYKCKECEYLFEEVHSMSERLTDCPECGKVNILNKIPNKVSVLNKDKEVGKIVESNIEELKKDLQEEKQKITKREFSND